MKEKTFLECYNLLSFKATFHCFNFFSISLILTSLCFRIFIRGNKPYRGFEKFVQNLTIDQEEKCSCLICNSSVKKTGQSKISSTQNILCWLVTNILSSFSTTQIIVYETTQTLPSKFFQFLEDHREEYHGEAAKIWQNCQLFQHITIDIMSHFK